MYLPTAQAIFCCTNDLFGIDIFSNSVHYYPNDGSNSFDVFYTLSSKEGLTWFIFPDYGIEIELRGTVVLSWDGNT